MFVLVLSQRISLAAPHCGLYDRPPAAELDLSAFDMPLHSKFPYRFSAMFAVLNLSVHDGTGIINS